MNSSNNTVARKKNAVFQRHIVPRKKKRMNCSNVFFFLGTKQKENLLYNSRQQHQASCISSMHPAADAALPACLPAIPTSRIAAAGHNHKHARTTRPATQTQQCLLAASLEAIPAEDWVRTWPAGRTIMLRSTSKGVKDVVDKMRLPAVVRLARGFWNKTGNTADQKLEIAMRQLLFMTGICRITTLELPMCRMKEQHAQKLAGVLIQCRELVHLDLQLNHIHTAGAGWLAGALGQCAALAHLDLYNNQIGPHGAESVAGVLAQCAALAHLNLGRNQIGDAGAERLAGVLAQCTALAHLDLRYNQIGPGGAESLAGVLPQCAALAHLDLRWNQIGPAGAERFVGVLAECRALAHLDLSLNQIGPAGAERLAGVLGQCAELAHLDLSANQIGPAGAESLAGELAQCTALAHLDLSYNAIGTAGQGRLRASWRGQASGLVL